MAKAILLRALFLWYVMGSLRMILIGTPISVKGFAEAYDLAVGQLLPESNKAPRIASLLPDWTWQTWLLLSVGLLCMFGFEVVFRKYGKQHILEKLIEEGERLLPLIVQQGLPYPEDDLRKYHARVVRELRRWFGNGYDQEWDKHINTAKPRVLSIGSSTINQHRAWNQVSAGLDWLRDFRMKQ